MNHQVKTMLSTYSILQWANPWSMPSIPSMPGLRLELFLCWAECWKATRRRCASGPALGRCIHDFCLCLLWLDGYKKIESFVICLMDDQLVISTIEMIWTFHQYLRSIQEQGLVLQLEGARPQVRQLQVSVSVSRCFAVGENLMFRRFCPALEMIMRPENPSAQVFRGHQWWFLGKSGYHATPVHHHHYHHHPFGTMGYLQL